MEFVERILGIKRRRQESLLHNFGISQKPRKAFVGPDYQEALVATVDNDKFLEVLRARDSKQFRTYLVHQSDTHQYHELFFDIGEGVHIKTGVAAIDYSSEETLLTKLHDIGFRPTEFKDRWGVYKQEDQSVT